jgi:sugar diacid utilization regulator
VDVRSHLSSLRSLLVLAQVMTETATEHQIVELAATAAPSLARCAAAAVRLRDGTAAGASWLVELIASGTAAARDDVWLYPVGSGGGLGQLAIAAPSDPDAEPGEPEAFLLQALAHQTGAALANARLHTTQRTAATELEALNHRLASTVEALQRSIDIHSRFTEVAVAGGGRDGIAAALHELTGRPVAIEDRAGHVQAWAGPRCEESAPLPPDRREELLARVQREGRPLRAGNRLIAVAAPQPDLLGVIVLHDDGGGAADEQEFMAVEHATTVLTMELARLRSIAETELRIRRDWVEDLLVGTDEQGALRRGQALGYDLDRPHRVLVMGHDVGFDAESAVHPVRRAARDAGVGRLVVARPGQVVVLADREADWSAFRERVCRELRTARCRVGVGTICRRVADFPRSYQEASTVLRLQGAAGWQESAMRFEDLGVYQLFATTQDPTELERFLRRWLGRLMDYDAAKGGALVETVSKYLECGGSYEATADALFVHRSTLKYRLQRIRQISGLDLTDPDTRFNLQLATRGLTVLTATRRETGHA